MLVIPERGLIIYLIKRQNSICEIVRGSTNPSSSSSSNPNPIISPTRFEVLVEEVVKEVNEAGWVTEANPIELG